MLAYGNLWGNLFRWFNGDLDRGAYFWFSTLILAILAFAVFGIDRTISLGFSDSSFRRISAMSTRIGEAQECEIRDHDLQHELGRRLDGVWWYDQYVAKADGRADLQTLWRKLKAEQLENDKQPTPVLVQHVENKSS